MADDNTITVKGMDEIIERMHQFPQKFKSMQRTGMDASLLVLQENVPPYPPQPDGSTYRRTGTLGRTLGSSGGRADIYQVKGLGTSYVEGVFGTRLNYAPYVIGDQQSRYNSHWWTLKSILPKAQDKIIKIWSGIMDKMADFLNSASSGVK